MTTAARPRFFLGWTVVAAAALATFTEVAFFNPVLGVFIPEFEREFGWSRTEISLGVTVGSLVGAAVAPVAGPLIDRYGGKWFIAGGSTIMALALVGLAFMQTEWQFFLIYAVGRGTAAGMITLAATVTVSKWFVRRRGFAVGITTLGTRGGFVLMPIGVQLIIGASDWRVAAIVLAATVGILGVLPVTRWLHPRPELLGLHPDGEIPAADEAKQSRSHLYQEEVSWSRRDAVRTRAFWMVTFAVSMMSWAGGAVNLHQIPHLVDRGLEPEAAALLISLFAVFGAGGTLVEGALDATIGARKTMIVGLIGSAVGMVILMNVNSFETGLVYAGVYGLSFGLMVTSNQVVFADYFGRGELGAIRGTAAPFQMGFNAIGPIVGGLAYDTTGSYLAAFIPFTLAYLIGAAALIIGSKPAMPARTLQAVEA